MKPTDFSLLLHKFMKELRRVRTEKKNEEPAEDHNTVKAYNDTFLQLIEFLQIKKKLRPFQITLERLTKETVEEFIEWIQITRDCGNSTCNNRLSAVRSFCRFVFENKPEFLEAYINISDIRPKKIGTPQFAYLSVEGIKLLLAQPDLSKEYGRRDFVLLALMYDTGGRVQEIIDLKPSSFLFLRHSSKVLLVGKGRKSRRVPLLDKQVIHLKGYLKEHGLDQKGAEGLPLFLNHRHGRLTRAGINYILKKHAKRAKQKDDKLIPGNLHCHSLRHTKAMHLLQAGVDIITIQHFLGHKNLITTLMYLTSDSAQKRKAMEMAYVNLNRGVKPIWKSSDDIFGYLRRGK